MVHNFSEGFALSDCNELVNNIENNDELFIEEVT